MSLLNSVNQRQRFYRLRGDFKYELRKLKTKGNEPFVMPFWREVNKRIESAFLPQPPLNFLSIREIQDTMFVQPDQKWIEAELSFLQIRLGSKFSTYAKEDSIGKPDLFSQNGIISSFNTLHHLYHIYRFESETKITVKSLSSIVEWGGGYGNMAKLWKRIKNQVTFTIIDTGLFSLIQWLYLSSIFGHSEVNLISSKNGKVEPGKINLVPLNCLKAVPIECDLFISTWGLSESKSSAQDYVVKQKWFGAKHLLIGFQDSNKDLRYASRLGELAAKDGAKIVDIEFIPKNHYAFK